MQISLKLNLNYCLRASKECIPGLRMTYTICLLGGHYLSGVGLVNYTSGLGVVLNNLSKWLFTTKILNIFKPVSFGVIL